MRRHTRPSRRRYPDPEVGRFAFLPLLLVDVNQNIV